MRFYGDYLANWQCVEAAREIVTRAGHFALWEKAALGATGMTRD
jgi:hypothetical protein